MSHRYLHGRKRSAVFSKEGIVLSPFYLEAKFKLVKTTRNTYRYQEEAKRSEWKFGTGGSIYLQKAAVEGKPPKKILVTVEEIKEKIEENI